MVVPYHRSALHNNRILANTGSEGIAGVWFAWQQEQVVFFAALDLCFPFAEKDVNRTDRTNRFYEGIDNPGLVLLHDILMTYCMYDFDLGERNLVVGTFRSSK